MKSARIMAKIAPSMLSSDFGRLAEEAERMLECGADWLHMDIMDGHFVPNLTIGPPVIQSLRNHTKAYLDCHCMVSNPRQWVKDLHTAGASQITFHIETTPTQQELGELIEYIRSFDMDVGVAIKPQTSLEECLDRLGAFMDSIDMILVMTVEPGFGGQSFMEDMMDKVSGFRSRYPSLNIQVDGGLGPSTIEIAAKAGANIIVAGSSIFKSEDPRETIALLRGAVENPKSQ